jgi:hypothetical protein
MASHAEHAGRARYRYTVISLTIKSDVSTA